MSEMSKDIFKINVSNLDQFKQYISELNSLINELEEEDKELERTETLVDLQTKINDSLYDLDSLNKLYMLYRNDPYFTMFIEKMKIKLADENVSEAQKDKMKNTFKKYTRFFSETLPLTKLLEAILKPMSRGIKKSSAVNLVKHFTEYFEQNCQKYYMSYITSGYECSMLMQDLFSDIGVVL